MESLEPFAWVVLVTLPVCIILAPVMLAVFEGALFRREPDARPGDEGDHEG